MGRHLAISAAAFIAVTVFFHSTSLAQIRQTMHASPATKPAHDPADVPVKEVVLFSSGVGYFEHAGTVNGDAVTELRFKTDQVNDILKSLLLQDMDGGNVGTVSYPGLAPLAHTLKSFQVDITANPDMADLLNQLRGAKLTVTSPLNNEPITGVILGVQKKLRPAGDKGAVEEITLNLKIGRQFRGIVLDDRITSMELDDPALQKELDDALTALTKARDQDKKPMTLHFNGKGARHVRIGYLVETPIWKTSYRLVFETAPAKAPATAPSHAPTTRPLGLNDGLPHPAKIQGWAIVENQTDNDWNDVSLSLVSGRPLSFIQDLYHAQYIPRPVVQADNHASLRPQTYAGGIYDIRDLVANAPDFTDAPDYSLNSTSNQKSQGGGGGGGGASLFSGGEGKGITGKEAQQNTQQPIDPTSSIVSAATAAKVGELFKYRVGNVSLARQTSAMIPIITDDIDAERVSIYNVGTLVNHPLLGARVRNNTKKYLLQGPMTVLDHGSYAGDARIDDLPPGQERLISFGIDQQLVMDATAIKQTSAVVTGKIAKGVMTLTSRNVMEQTYLADNKSDETRVLVIEHPRQPEFKLVTPSQAEETTGELFRFRRSIPPHKTAKFTVAEEHVVDSSIQIVMLGSAELGVFVRNVAIPQNVRDALMKAIELKNQVLMLNGRISELHRQKDELGSDQARVRDNLKAVSGESDYYKRMMKKMDEQENEIEKIQKALVETQQLHQSVEKQLSEYIAGLTVG